jgi:hypothetical protein
MFPSLVEHFDFTIWALLTVGAALVFLFWHLIIRFERKIDKLFEIMGNMVSHAECVQKHKDLLILVNALIRANGRLGHKDQVDNVCNNQPPTI